MREDWRAALDGAGICTIVCDEPMSRHTSFRIGGPADAFASPADADQLRKLIAFCREEEVPFEVIGNGTNLLVGDRGYRGLIISLYGSMGGITAEGCRLRAGAGAMLAAAAREAVNRSLSGLEFGSGIPGTVGGAVFMNAGAYDGEMKDVTEQVTLMDQDGTIRTLPGTQMEFGYRTSLAQTQRCFVLEAVLRLEEGNREAIRERIEELRKMRTAKQPLELPSAGSTFKRPKGWFAGKLIMDSGLRGYRVGGAQVSEKHCGFIVNTGGATAADVRALMDHVRRTVMERFGVELEPEVRMLGEF